MSTGDRANRRAVTWVDVLVTAGLAVLLIPLVLPALSSAAEQARVAQCLANLNQVMRATSIYLQEYEGNFPLWTPGGTGSSICSWAYGGKTNDEYWKTASSGLFYVPATQRWLNTYLLGAQVQPDVVTGGHVVARTPIPMLQCPSDRYSHQRSFSWPSGAQALSCYDDVGTSYQLNLHAMIEDVSWYGDTDPWHAPGTWEDYLRTLLWDVRARQGRTFTFLLEDPMDWGLANHTSEVGNHGEFNKHSCGYLDGHGDYVFADTRGYCGVGWEAINISWVVNPEHVPPIRYVSTWINCNP
jgi:hypothetical protein